MRKSVRDASRLCAPGRVSGRTRALPVNERLSIARSGLVYVSMRRVRSRRRLAWPRRPKSLQAVSPAFVLSITILIMSFVLRRAALRAAPRTRGFATSTVGQSYREQQEAMVHHAAGTFIFVPAPHEGVIYMPLPTS